jgi:CxxC motif-containing protein (DUF1111 family)
MKTRLIFAALAATSLSLAAIAAGVANDGAGSFKPVSPFLGAATTQTKNISDAAFTYMATNALPEHQRPFFFGNRLFNTNWVIAPASVKSFDGLGPFFNRVSCSGCHTKDGRGRPPLSPDEKMDSMLIRLSVPDAASPNGASPHPVYGDQLSEDAILGVAHEGKTKVTTSSIAGTYGDGEPYELLQPHYEIADLGYGDLGKDIMLSPRVAPQMIGLGLLEAVPAEALLANADPDDKNGDGISGRANQVMDPLTNTPQIGRFGWKANQPNLDAQNGGAANGDIGITNPLHKIENCAAAQTACLAAPIGGNEIDMSDKFFEKLNLYTRLLAVPAQRNPTDAAVMTGQQLFSEFGCASCHLPTLKTGAKAALPELENQIFHPFTDLLLHDMGKDLADNRPDNLASGSEWRTPPLWGIGLFQTVNGHNRLLHDGRARGPAEAILWHGGEAEAAKEAFRNAPKTDRDALVAFLNSL